MTAPPMSAEEALAALERMEGEEAEEADGNCDAFFERFPKLAGKSTRLPVGVSPIEVLTDAEFSLLQPGPQRLAGILPTAGEVVVTGDFSVGKSALALAWGAHLALERDWGGRKVIGGPVLYLIGEGATGLASRWRNLKAQLGVTTAPVYFVRARLSLMERATPERIVAGLHLKGLDQLPFAALVADTWSRLGAGAEENSNDDTTLRLDTACLLGDRLNNPLRIFLHHPAKGKEDSRGASSLENGADTVIRLARPKDSDIVTVSCFKQRDGERFAPFTFRLDGPRVVDVEEPRPEGDWRAANRRHLSKPEERALEILHQAKTDPEYATDGMPSKRWELASGVQGGSFDRTRSRLAELGYIRLVKRIGNSNRYAITGAGETALFPHD